MGYKKLSNEQEKHLVTEYINGASVLSLMEKYNFKTKKSITDKVKKYYPDNYKQLIEKAKINRKGYNFSLKKIQNEFDAYLIGLLLTDGYITSDRDGFGIDLTDEDCISFLSKGLNVNYKTYSYNEQNKKDRHRIIVSQKGAIKDLERFGIVPKKSLILPKPQLLKEEEQFIPYIIRGIIDGDGCVSPTNYGGAQFHIISMSEEFIDWCKDALENKMYMKDIRKSQGFNGIWKIESSNQDNILKLISLSYNKPYGMNRKYKLLRRTFRDYNKDALLYNEDEGIVQTTTEKGLGN